MANPEAAMPARASVPGSGTGVNVRDSVCPSVDTASPNDPPLVGLEKPVASTATSAALKPVIPPVAWAIGHWYACVGSKPCARPGALAPVSVSSATVNRLFAVVPAVTARPPETVHKSQLDPAVPAALLISHMYEPPAP